MAAQSKSLPAVVVSVIDGDTLLVKLRFDLDFGIQVWIEAPLRLEAIDCPEMNTAEGLAAKQYTIGWVNENQNLTLTYKGKGRDKYARFLGYLKAENGKVLNDDLLKDGYARKAKVPKWLEES